MAPKVAPNEKTLGASGPPASSTFSKANDFRRAGDRTRTGDVQLGKLAFYQLNYARKRTARRRKRRRPRAIGLLTDDGEDLADAESGVNWLRALLTAPSRRRRPGHRR